MSKILLCMCLISSILFGLVSCSSNSQNDETEEPVWSGKPVLGWNSFISYHNFFREELARENLEAFNEILKPHGYEYFILDNGWAGGDHVIELDEYGRNLPYKPFYPEGVEGFKAFVNYAHSLDIKIGVWIVRGINRDAVRQNLPIKGTKYFAQDIVDTTDTCYWCNHNWGVDMSKPGAQEYYDSKVDLLAEWGVDFIKYDDVVDYPDEITAIAKAVEKAKINHSKDIILSISPGNRIDPELAPFFRLTDMVRISFDIWDKRSDIDAGFKYWKKMLPYRNSGFHLDLDMIPFGFFVRSDKNRHDLFTFSQKKSFLTQRAIAASPLIMGGSLTKSEEYNYDLITNEGMLECNQNGITGTVILEDSASSVFVWGTDHRLEINAGWVGVFNRSLNTIKYRISKENLGLKKNIDYKLTNVWDESTIEDSDKFSFIIPPDDVVFIKYQPEN